MEQENNNAIEGFPKDIEKPEPQEMAPSTGKSTQRVG